MHICIPIEFQPHGGGHYFLQSFERYLRDKGHGVHKRVEARSDLLFTNHWMTPRREILRAIRHNPEVRIVQRIDGAAQDYGRHPEADQRQRAVNRLADLTIFQSEYCRYSTRKKFPVIQQDGPVIHNPVDLELFSPEGDRRSFPHKILVAGVTWSQNPHKGSASIYEVAAAHPDVGFVLCGNYPDAPDLPNIHALGVLNRTDLSVVLRSCNALLTFSRNEACPNHVLEALASGLPVLHIDSGAMTEVIGEAGLPVTIETFRSQLDALMLDHKRLTTHARTRAETLFVPNEIFARYMAELQGSLDRPTRLPFWQRNALAWLDPVLNPLRSLGFGSDG